MEIGGASDHRRIIFPNSREFRIFFPKFLLKDSAYKWIGRVGDLGIHIAQFLPSK